MDSYRSVSTELGGKQDLKDKMASMNSLGGFESSSCNSDEAMYLRQVSFIYNFLFRVLYQFSFVFIVQIKFIRITFFKRQHI